MRVLPRNRTQPAHLPKQPLDDLIAAAQIAWQKLAGFFSEIEQNCPGLEHGYWLAANRRVIIDDCGHAVVGRECEKLRLELVTDAYVHRDHGIFEPGLFAKE